MPPRVFSDLVESQKTLAALIRAVLAGTRVGVALKCDPRFMYKIGEKMRNFMVKMRKTAAIAAPFRLVLEVFDDHNRDVVFIGGAFALSQTQRARVEKSIHFREKVATLRTRAPVSFHVKQNKNKLVPEKPGFPRHFHFHFLKLPEFAKPTASACGPHRGFRPVSW